MDEMTNPSRRAMLKVGAVAPLAALMPSAVMAALPATVSHLAAPAPATTPIAAVWEWWASADGERYTVGPFATRAEAEKSGLGNFEYDGSFHLLEATKSEPDLRLDGNDVLEMIDGRNEDHFDPDGDATIFANSLSDEVVDDLGRVVSQAIKAWADRHNVTTHSYLFDGTRHHEVVKVPDLPPAALADVPASLERSETGR